MLAATGAPEYVGDDTAEHVLLCRSGYVLSHNNENRIPDWVLERLTPDRFTGPGDRNEAGNPFKADTDLPAGKRSELSDYKSSGFDRGHMAPAGDMKFSEQAMNESFYLSNMAPQIGVGLNRGIWANLEKLTRDWTCEKSELIVITGPIITDNPKHIGNSAVVVPSAFYKIAYDPARKRAIAFILPNRKVDLKGQSPWQALKAFIVPISEIEDGTGLNFLATLTDREQRKIERQKAAMWPDRGDCAQN